MNATIDLPASSVPIRTDIYCGPDRRVDPRRGCHTVVTAFSADHLVGEGLDRQVIKAHSEDVSVSGAKLISQHPLPCERIYLRFLLPTFGDQYVEAQVVNHSIRGRQSLNGRVSQQHIYGVRFTGVMTDGEMVDQMLPRLIPSERRDA